MVNFRLLAWSRLAQAIDWLEEEQALLSVNDFWSGSEMFEACSMAVGRADDEVKKWEKALGF